jgi:hypothetical protein
LKDKLQYPKHFSTIYALPQVRQMRRKIGDFFARQRRRGTCQRAVNVLPRTAFEAAYLRGNYSTCKPATRGTWFCPS